MSTELPAGQHDAKRLRVRDVVLELLKYGLDDYVQLHDSEWGYIDVEEVERTDEGNVGLR